MYYLDVNKKISYLKFLTDVKRCEDSEIKIKNLKLNPVEVKGKIKRCILY